MFPTQGIQFSQVCGRIIRYQIGAPQAFRYVNQGIYSPQTIDDPYVDGLSLTYGTPSKHIWTFANATDETTSNPTSRCTCASPSRPNPPPSFVGNDYFCEIGVPPGQGWSIDTTFHAYGMVKVVVQLAHAAHSTIHHGFVNNYLSQLMLI